MPNGRDLTIRNGDGNKECLKCSEWLPESSYARNAASGDGLQSTCRTCRKAYADNNYSAGKTCGQCSVKIVNKSQHSLCRVCFGLSRRGLTKTKTKTVHGYVLLTGYWDHPNANNRGQVLEHVYVVSEKLGRPLRRGENVHHINGVRDDNRPENLELWISSQPPGQRVADQVRWAREILAAYGDEMESFEAAA